jgi:hypothetical protein
MYFIDVNGLYSYCALNFPYMTNKYKVLIGNDVSQIQINEFKFYVNNTQIYGTMLITILPPQNLFKPFLLYRTKSGTVVNALCRVCAETEKNMCRHTDSERAFTASYFITEVSKALSLGYKLLYIHECHYYSDTQYLFKDFVKMLYFQKLRHSDLFKNCTSFESKKTYLTYLNNKMNFSEPYELKISNIDVNPRKQFFFKQMANSFFGKFLQKTNKTQTVFVANQAQLEELFVEEKNVKSIYSYGNFCQVEIEQNLKKLPPNRTGNCYIGGQITAFAREIIYNHLLKIENAGGTLYYVDCDSIIFTLPVNKKFPVSMSHAIGDFKFELEGEIINFYSFGPKNYTIMYEAHSMKKVATKVKGLSLKGVEFQHEITNEIFQKFLDSTKHEEKEIVQVRMRKKSDGLYSQMYQPFTFRNHFSKRRIVDKSNFVSFPYGWRKS